VDACNAFSAAEFGAAGLGYTGIGRGRTAPDAAFVDLVTEAFRDMERAVAAELRDVTTFLNERHAQGYDRVDLDEVRRLAATCVTGCDIVSPPTRRSMLEPRGFRSRLSDW
jgi:hypothetical protein